jgi:thiol:disulfide interchange protein DsbD
VPTAIAFTNNPLVQFTAPLKEQGKKETYTDKVAGITQYQYADSVVYTRPIRLRGQAKTSISGTITYQACTSEMCLPVKAVSFTIGLQ